MIRLLSRRSHGVVDYLTVGALLALPRMLGWNRSLTGLLTGSALSSLVYSLLTRYEFGLIRTIPFQAHLALDAISAVSLLTAPEVMDESDSQTNTLLVAIGLFELMAVLTTDPRS